MLTGGGSMLFYMYLNGSPARSGFWSVKGYDYDEENVLPNGSPCAHRFSLCHADSLEPRFGDVLRFLHAYRLLLRSSPH